MLQVTGTVAVDGLRRPGPEAAADAARRSDARSRARSRSASELENDGTLRALAGGTLAQSTRSPARPTARGVFDAQGTGVLSLSNVLMGAASSATGTGTIRFAGGTSRVAPGAGYAAGITELGNGGMLDFDDDGSTGALRLTGDGTRRGDGTLTVGSGQSSLGLEQLRRHRHDQLQRRLADHDHRHRRFLRRRPHAAAERHHHLVGRHVQIQDAGTVENAGLLQVTGTVVVGLRYFGRPGRKLLADAARGSDRGLGHARGRRRSSRTTARCAPCAGGTLDAVQRGRQPGRQRAACSTRRARACCR